MSKSSACCWTLAQEAGANTDFAGEHGSTALSFASCRGHVEVVRLLLEAGANKDLADDCKNTALIKASYEGHVEVVRLLLEAGANPDLADEHGSTALIFASDEGHVEVVRLLEAGADQYAAIKTAWMLAFENANSAVSCWIPAPPWMCQTTACCFREILQSCASFRKTALTTQDWLTQNFSRSIAVESSVANPEIPPSPSHVDVKKAARKYLKDKFQARPPMLKEGFRATSSQAPANPQNGGGAATEDDDLSFPATVSAMMAALDYSSTEGAPSLVPEETAGVLMAQIGNWDFNVVGFSEVVGSQTLRFMAKVALEPCAELLLCLLRPNVSSLECVLRSLESRYHRTNPYHNGVHAADVLNSFLYYLGYFNKSGNLFRHDGKSSRYHMTTESPLALLFSDQSVLEMMHCSILFADWDFDSRQAFRKQVMRMILDTDLAKHFEQVKTFRENLQDILSFVLKLSDIGGSAKPFTLHAQWATRINAEFFLQGDLEREVGLPCSPFCDRKVNLARE
eukprot:s1775_g4.t1